MQMELFLVFAITIVAGIFICKIATLPQSPRFDLRERISRKATLYRIKELAKTCAITERGGGIEIERTLRNLERAVSKVKKRDGELWTDILLAAEAVISSAIGLCRGARAATAKLGHVRGVPRLFLLCDMIVGSTRGGFDRGFLDDAVNEFCCRAPLDSDEKRSLPAMLAFCLCGLLERAVKSGAEQAERYDSGLSDGANDVADLDMLCYSDYVCGLADGAKDGVAIERLFADNGISASDSAEARRASLAELAATVDSIISALTDISSVGGFRACPHDFGAVFFGGETMSKKNVISNSRLAVAADNRGDIRLSCDRNAVSVPVSLEITVNGKVISLRDTDGVFQCYRTVYRTFDGDFEFAAEIIAPPDDPCCLIGVSVINRTAQSVCVSVASACGMPSGFADREVRRIKNIGAAFAVGDAEVGVCSDAPCECVVKSIDKIWQGLSVERKTVVNAFGAATVLFGIVIDKNISAVRLAQISDSMYFERSLTASKAYYADMYKDMESEADSSERFIMRKVVPDIYAAVAHAKECEFGFTDSGYCVPCDVARQSFLKSSISDGELSVEILADGNSKTDISDGSEYGSLNVVFCENGVIWSPLGELSGDGATCEFCRGYTVHKSVRNGCAVTLTRTLVRGKRAELLLLTVENRTDDNRNIDVMFTSEADPNARVLINADKIYALCNNGFALFSSEAPIEFCEHREGYLDHGRIARASNFKSGGETPAPALSVSVELPPRAEKKIAFCRAAITGGDTLDEITVEKAERIISAERRYYSECGRVALRSSDPELNAAYSQSLYAAHIGLYRQMRLGRYDRALLSCFAVKYADPKLVLDTVLKLCEKQESCGRLDVGQKTPIATLLLPLVIIDYVDFCGDCRIFGENIGFCCGDGITVKPASVLEHCFRAIDFSILISTRMDEKTDKAFSTLLLRAVRAFLEYSANSDRVKAYAGVATRLSLSAQSGIEALAAADIEFDPLGVATAYARYEISDNECAYKAIKALVDKALHDENGLPRLFYSTDSVTPSLFFTLVTEKLLGISMRGDRARISPNTASNTPHIEFSVLSESGEAKRVLVDDGEERGAWQINCDRISIASDIIRIGDASEQIIMRRSGDAG